MGDTLNKAFALGNFIEENNGSYMTDTINKATITDNQVKDIYNKLAPEDATSTELLKAAEEETESTEYSDIEEIEIDDSIAGVNTKKVNPTENDYREVLDEYNITNEEAKSMIDLINNYRSGDTNKNYYELLPKSFKDIADGIRNSSAMQGQKVSRNNAAMFLLDQLINDSEFTNIMNSFQSEFANIATEMNTGYNKILSDAFNEVFENIDKIETEDPEKAKTIRAIKAAFDKSIVFDDQLEYAKKIGANKLTKLAGRLDSEAIYFNKKVNATDVKIPDISELVPIIHDKLPDYDIETIKKFIIILCKTMEDVDVENDVAGLAYIYKTINNIYIYRFIDIADENATLLFRNIATVLDCIKNK